jgi:hypothetical protein
MGRGAPPMTSRNCGTKAWFGRSEPRVVTEAIIGTGRALVDCSPTTPLFIRSILSGKPTCGSALRVTVSDHGASGNNPPFRVEALPAEVVRARPSDSGREVGFLSIGPSGQSLASLGNSALRCQ